MPELIIEYPDGRRAQVQLGRLRITIGRSPRNDLSLPDPLASAVHAEVRRDGNKYLVEDLGSANGTLYEGEPVNGQVTLRSGGRIQIGETVIIYSEESQSFELASDS